MIIDSATFLRGVASIALGYFKTTPFGTKKIFNSIVIYKFCAIGEYTSVTIVIVTLLPYIERKLA